MSKPSKRAAARKAWGIPDPLSLSPIRLNEHAWYYEEAGGISLHVWTELPRAMSYKERHHVNISIPWRKLLASAKRKRAALGKTNAPE